MLDKFSINQLIDAMYENIEFCTLYSSDIIELHDTIWFEKDGLVVPKGELHLPVHYASGENESFMTFEIATIFQEPFFRGIKPTKDSYLNTDNNHSIPFCNGDGYLTNPDDYDMGIARSLFVGEGSLSSARETILSHLGKFLGLYSKLSEILDDDARMCVAKSFVNYS